MSSAAQGKKPAPREVPARFLASKATLRFDRFMGWAIQAGGVGIIIAVFGIFVFITAEIIPLFRGAKVGKPENFTVGATHVAVMGVDEWAGKPFLYSGGREITFAGLAGKQAPETAPLTLPEGAEPGAWQIDPRLNRVTVGTKDGRIGAFRVLYNRGANNADGTAAITGTVKMEDFTPIGQQGKPLVAVACGDAGAAKICAAIQDVDGKLQAYVQCIREKRGLLGAGKPQVVGTFDLTPSIEGKPVRLIASANGDSILVASDKGILHYFYFPEGTSMELRQKFQPFKDLPDPSLTTMGYVFGDVSLVLTSADGHQEVWSLYNHPVEENGKKFERRLFGRTKDFPKLAQGATFYAASQRNKTFLCGYGHFASLRYTTTENVRWEDDKLPFEITHAAFDAKADHLIFLDMSGALHRQSMSDPHPEAGWHAFFGKVWYEGASKPEYTWQSTGGTDDFEPKISLTPLVFGSLKGTLYTMLFALPIAILAAIYSACFLPPEIKALVKPIMEVMASLPSVVLGFLAGLWLAPLIEERVPSLILVAIMVPVGIMLFGWGWTRLPVGIRAKVRPGFEYVILLVPLVLLIWVAWLLGPVLEKNVFVVPDATGKTLADFRLWWPKITGLSFDQRNCIVVGFMMGFAVIPIIFTISDDALSNVPPQLKAASLALGASRWQMVRTVVLPVASAGIFSAVMIGLGRAVGETMVMVMATGNTANMDWNIFSGMRTLSANIAVELPEAAVGSTHFRTLFLGAAVLFAITFFLNTAAEITRQRLREKFKLV